MVKRYFAEVKSTIFEATCAMCAKKFDVNIRYSDGKILTKNVYYGGVIVRGIGNWSSHEWIGWDDKKCEPILKKVHPWYREFKYRLIDWKRKTFGQYKEIEYWECPKCNRKSKKDATKKSGKP